MCTSSRLAGLALTALIVATPARLQAGYRQPAETPLPDRQTAAKQQQADPPEAAASVETSPATEGKTEWGFFAGFAQGQVTDAVDTSTDFFQLLVRWAYRLGPRGGNGRPGNFAVVIEGVPLFTISQEPRAYGAGLNLLLRYSLASGDWRPMVLGGAGLLATSEEVPPGESRFNFSPQIGVGLQRRIQPGLLVALEYRFYHISNAGITENNPGINTHLIAVGITLAR